MRPRKPDSNGETNRQRHEAGDAVLLMLGVGKHLWTREPGDRFIERLRSEDTPPDLGLARRRFPSKTQSERENGGAA